LVPASTSSRLTRRLFLRALGVVYLIAFLSLEGQVEGLFGADGLQPAAGFLERAGGALGGTDFLRLPTLFWLGAGDDVMSAACWLGVAAALALISGVLPLASLVVLFALYLSFVSVGAPFLQYQWDALLLETGFLAIFWAPTTARLRSPRAAAPSQAVGWLLRWLVFRLMFFSGWVKLASGDPTWWDLSALQHHYQTQPLPTWTAWYMNQLPDWFQRLSVAAMFVVELILPFFVFAGRRPRAIAAGGFVGLQVLIAATGNYGFFNLLAAVLCISLLDDAQLLALVPSRWRSRGSLPQRPRSLGGRVVSAALTAVILLLSVPAAITQLTGIRSGPARLVEPVARLARPFHLTNRYGLFAVMTRTRPEVVIEGSRDGVHWLPYRFRWKAGPLDRRPAFVEPDMPRLDWQMWFDGLALERALRSGRRPTGLVTPALIRKLREGSPAVLRLLEDAPFDGPPPPHLRFGLYDYRFTDAAERNASGRWWNRRLLWPAPAP